ncbi:MAG: hypothetical protein Tsb0020_28660 [Haliangiales bacterium]
MPSSLSRAATRATVAIGLYGWVNGSLAAGVVRLDERLDLSATVIALHLVFFAVGLIGAGLLSQRLPRLVRRHATALFAAALIPLLAAPHAALSIAAALALGGFGSLSMAAAQAAIARVGGARSARVLLIANLAAAATSALSAFVIGAVAVELAVLAAVAALAVGVYARVAPEPSGVDALGAGDSAQGSALDRASGDGALDARAARTPLPVLAGLLMAGCAASVEYTLANQLGSFLIDTHVTASWAALAPSLLFGGLTAGRVVGVFITRVAPMRTLSVSLLIVGAGLVPIWLLDSAWLRLAATFGVGVGLGSLYPLTVSVILAASPHPERTSAHTTVAVGISLLTVPLITGVLTDVTTPRQGFTMIVALVGLAAVALAAMPRGSGAMRAGEPRRLP